MEELHPFSRADVDALAAELGPRHGPMVVFAAETGLRTNEWVALERRDVDRPAVPHRAAPLRGRHADTLPQDRRSRRRLPLSARAFAALEALPARLDSPLQFPAFRGGHIGLDTWRARERYRHSTRPGSRSAGPYHLRHTFATECLAAGVMHL